MWRIQGMKDQLDATIKSTVNMEESKQTERITLNEQCVWEGIGIIQFPDGSTYQGMTKNAQFNGKGRMTHANGDIYQGEWKDGKANG